MRPSGTGVGDGIAWAGGPSVWPQCRQKFIPGWLSPPQTGQWRTGNPGGPGGVEPTG